jgi:hypothetical protein
MADLSEKDSSSSTKLVGSDSNGVETYFVGADSSGNLRSIISGSYSGSPVQISVDSAGRLYIADVSAGAKVSFFSYLNSGVSYYSTYSVTQNLSIKQMVAGGTGSGICTLAKYTAATNQFINEGDFENASAFGTTWVASSPGTGLTSFSQSTTQKVTGSNSGRVVYAKSDANNYVSVKQTYSSLDLTGWRYITASFYHDTPVGAAVTRTVYITLTSSNGDTRSYTTTFLTTQAAGWVTITGEIENPSSATGTGFDPSDIISVELKFIDSSNRAGTIYWDTVKVSGSITAKLKLYWQANSNARIDINPVETFLNGETLLLIIKNSDTSRKEFSVFASGVAST